MKLFFSLLLVFSAQLHAQTDSAAMGLWKPTLPDECTQEQHDAFFAIGPDNKRYPVSHPEVDPTGCSYEHAHTDHVTHIPPASPVTNSMAMGLWKPSTNTFLHPNECTQAEHDSYKIQVGNKWFPTWHPPVHVRFPAVGAEGETPAVAAVTCNFGHEHGRDPTLSPIYDPSKPIVFGAVNEQMMLGPMLMRHEDHVGHKVMFGSAEFSYKGATERLRCDVITKLHQGTHSPDALTNNLHELTKQFQCSDGFKINLQIMAQIGRAGWIEDGANTMDIYVGVPTPADSPIVSNPNLPGKSMGDRDLPTNNTMYLPRMKPFEQWRISVCIMAIGEKGCAIRFADYWGVSNPSRFYDPAYPNKMARSIDVCWLKKEDGAYVAEFGPCVSARKAGITLWDDIRSPFRGTSRSLRMDSFTWRNATGPEVIWTDPLGYKASETEFPGSVKQEVSRGTHAPIGAWTIIAPAGIVNGTSPDLTGVHAPN